MYLSYDDRDISPLALFSSSKFARISHFFKFRLQSMLVCGATDVSIVPSLVPTVSRHSRVFFCLRHAVYRLLCVVLVLSLRLRHVANRLLRIASRVLRAQMFSPVSSIVSSVS